MTKVFKQITLAITLLISFLGAGQALAQNATDTIRVDYSFWGNSYYLGDTEHSKSEIRDILYANPSSQKLVKSYSTNKTWGYITLTAGTLLTGAALYSTWESHTNYGNSDNSGTFALTTALAIALDLAGIMQLANSNKKFNKAIKAYNKNSFISSLDYDFYIGYNRIGVVVVFN
ncbi:MAG: hypothetical protein CVV22_12405 [Ignavibacteriae bacterium HGW-Ignavibacteriae-1]|jgi:hypothetical protein|nr:MAG: hypothetical protein CVV22_12405 [Ignavibacteriae bacterium HGW-Ignavibacteriae-1]